ncbi:hypothetical protein [Clostridium kluyveri]|uniref:DUF2281 domain-containing protein n=2 Tax=Clostridium kluyveri TaxID=1534 RepID=A5N1S5_CLOK5|nr:hypothetical protein [Clostridium kluyveri]EDK35071.1 Hypothetical protein CKL_3063 [Clostridium kluyveri DSM 555]BAH07759.1 hypothetical protein CKR_2708 [Clostridium kluyveri NBRC 12016]
MSSLAKKIIEKLNKENDVQILAEVLDFYEYLKQKKSENLQKRWECIEEDEPTEEEIKSYDQYKESKEEVIPLENIMEELNLYEK